jgi:HAD superfamily hydrolase (TIGR01484 family)
MSAAKHRYRALATDFDGTIAHDGQVPEETQAGLRQLRKEGWKVILVTGREIADLTRVFPHLDLFDLVVGENGALLYSPKDAVFQRLCEAPPAHFVERLIAKGVGPISIGHAIVATWEPHQAAVLETIKEMGLDLQVIFNKGAVMILPQSVNKASGLQAALDTFKIKPVDVVAVGDAENDHAMLELCGLSVAVANALPAVKEHAKLVTKGSHGAGVAELIASLLTPAKS